MLPEDATGEDRARLIEALGLDGPLLTQYRRLHRQRAARAILARRCACASPRLTSSCPACRTRSCIIPWALLLAMLVGIPLGVVAALNRGRFLDRASGTIAVLGIATPSFWLGIVLIFVFSVELGWLPSGRMGGPEHYVLPVITLGTFLTAGFMRLTRSSMLDVLESEYVKLARIKGLSESVVIWKHCLRNALIPVLTLWGVFVGNLITGAIVTETVFAWPGVGRLTYEAVIYRDFPLLQAVIILKAILILHHQPRGRHSLCLCRSAHQAQLSDRECEGCHGSPSSSSPPCFAWRFWRRCWHPTRPSTRRCATSCCRRSGWRAAAASTSWARTPSGATS